MVIPNPTTGTSTTLMTHRSRITVTVITRTSIHSRISPTDIRTPGLTRRIVTMNPGIGKGTNAAAFASEFAGDRFPGVES
jgi:hypothetical protein